MSVMLQEDYPLRNFTTFKIGGTARYFLAVTEVADIFQVLPVIQTLQQKVCILGGGSNVLVSDHGFEGVVLKIETKGVAILEEDSHTILLKVAAGEGWDDLVANVVASGWWGVENLSNIPGTVGALPIQNVGAYGQEASDVIEAVEVCDMLTGKMRVLTNQECQFRYRTSVFNTVLKGQYLIVYVWLRLHKQGKPCPKYPDLQAYFQGHQTPSLQEIRKAILQIRQRKLPDPSQIGNVGSFFKNLLLTEEEHERLQARIQDYFGEAGLRKLLTITHRFLSPDGIKIPTAFLLDLCGLQGLRVGDAALYHNQPLIIVNVTGHATAHDVMLLVKMVRHQVYRATGIELVPEPTLIGFHEEELSQYLSLD